MRGLTLIEAIIAIFIFSIIFLGLFTGFLLGLKIVTLSKYKSIAQNIALAELEKIRNMPYSDIGTIGANLPYASGTLEALKTVNKNYIDFTVSTTVIYQNDPADDAGGDPCPNDYKKVEIQVSWVEKVPGSIFLSSNFTPPTAEYECYPPAGVLSVLVLDAFGNTVNGPEIQIKDLQNNLIASAVPSSGEYDFILAPSSTYKVIVFKNGYSSERTYGFDEIAQPLKPHPFILQGKKTKISFAIDKLSTFKIETLYPFGPTGTSFFLDSFDDETKISEKYNVIVASSSVFLNTTSTLLEVFHPKFPKTLAYYVTTTECVVGGVGVIEPGCIFYSPGYVISIPVEPTNLLRWDKFTFTEHKPPGTEIKYQILYYNTTTLSWQLIPDSDLPGNSTGFTTPINLSSLSITKYSKIKAKATLSTTISTSSPALDEWKISWVTTGETKAPNVWFNLRGEKILGKDAFDNFIYKYSQTLQTNPAGKLDLPNMEWDNYTFSLPSTSNLNLVGTDPSPQPISLFPNGTVEVKLYVDALHTLFITVKDAETSEPIFSATTTIKKGNFEMTSYTDEKGQVVFLPLEEGTYDVYVTAPGYSSSTQSVFVSGHVFISVNLNRLE